MPAARTQVSNDSIRRRNPGWTRCFAWHHALPVPPWPPPFARRPATQPAPVPPAQGNHAANACSPLLIGPVFSSAIGTSCLHLLRVRLEGTRCLTARNLIWPRIVFERPHSARVASELLSMPDVLPPTADSVSAGL